MQAKANAIRCVLETLTPFPAAIKGLLAELHGLPSWPVKLPLEPFPEDKIKAAADDFRRILE